MFTDREVRIALEKKGFVNTELEWMRCAVSDVRTVLTELRTGTPLGGGHYQTFTMRDEQAEAVNRTHAYFVSRWAEDMHAVPRFLWNAKMRFGKTFTTYQLVRRLGAKRVLVATFKPAVGDAWRMDLESHADFDGWQYLSKATGGNPTQIDRSKPVVYFGSFQDLLGRDSAGNIKPRNKWLHQVYWDLVVFDEYHFGAWRETAKELFEGEEDVVSKKETKLEYAASLNDLNEDLTTLSHKKQNFFRSLRVGTFIFPAHRSGLWLRANLLRNRYSTGRILTSNAPKKDSPASIQELGTHMARCLRSDCLLTRCLMNCLPSRAQASSTSSTLMNFS